MSFYKSGRLSSKACYKDHQLNGEFTGYKNAAGSPIEKVINFLDNRIVDATTYYDDGSYAVSDYSLDGRLGNLPVRYDFYTADKVLYHSITNPTNRRENKTITDYDIDGQIHCTTSKRGQNSVFELRTRQWNGWESVGLIESR